MPQLSAIEETSYLSVPRASIYRKIMRCFFREYEKMHIKLYKEDVYQLLEREELGDYSMEQLELDLDALVKWRNLTPIQDPGRVYTIADYKNKQYTYSMSEYAVEIERMTVRLENLFLGSGNLSTNFLVRLECGLEEAQTMKEAPLRKVNEWWNSLQEDFRRLIQNYQDYLRDFYSGRADRLMKSVEFVLHKDKFVKYLNEFVQELQRHARQMEKLLTREAPLIEETLLERVIQSELEIPYARLDEQGNAEPSIRENVYGKWQSLKNWFLDSEERECECRKVLRITNDIIRSIIQNAALIVQMQNWGISRKDDYQKFLRMFLDCESMEDAHRLSAHVFGIQRIQHFSTHDARDEDSIHRSVYEEPPGEYLLKPHTRKYRERKERRGFTDKSVEKLIQREQYLKRAKLQKETVLRYIRDGRIVLSEIDGILSETTRTMFLTWISQANMNAARRGRTEYGQEYVLRRGEGECVLHCEDGDLTMPDYILEFD